jgi:hypothetical protein
MTNRAFVAALVAMLAGLLIWAAHFLLVYGFTALACARRFAAAELFGIGVVPLAVGIVTVVAALATAAVLLLAVNDLGPSPPERDATAAPHFMRWMTAGIAGLSLAAIVWEGLTAAIIPACA